MIFVSLANSIFYCVVKLLIYSVLVFSSIITVGLYFMNLEKSV